MLVTARGYQASVGPVRLPAPADLARWQAECTELFGVANDHVSWCWLDWYDDQGVNRLVVYQMVPRGKISAVILDALTGPELDWDAEGRAKGAILTRAQWALWKRFGAYAIPYWILQGHAGGHRRRFSATEQRLLRARRQPETPPIAGDLPYAPWDERVKAKLLALDKIRFWEKAIDYADRTAADLDADERQAVLDMRMAYHDWLDSQVGAAVDGLNTWKSPLVSDDMVSRETRPIDVDLARHQFIHADP